MPGGWHEAYAPAYEHLCEPLRHITGYVAECGVDGGGSLAMWRDYFKHDSPIIGIDINPCPDAIKGDEWNIKHIQRDAYEMHCVQFLTLYEPFKLLIDDGSHFLEHQIFFCSNYPRLLHQKGLLIVEDVQSIDHIETLAKSLPEGMFSMAIDLRHHGRYDNILFVASWQK